jgi:hypothetical protein
LLSQGRAILEIVQTAYVISATLENATQGELQRYETNYKALNLITTALVRNVYDCVSHHETAHDVWLKICNTYEGSSKISHLIRILIISNIKHFLRNLESISMIASLGLNLL